MPPLLATDFAALIVEPTDSLATGIIKTYVRLPVLLYRLWKWMMNPDGTITFEFRDWLCTGCNDLQVIEDMAEEAA